ncbi:hypothetical protein FJ365_00335 [Candidatus Dependentiae bacterium]|nr:hypothetical protein [Candidatus Dependentiae bacterium]
MNKYNFLGFLAVVVGFAVSLSLEAAKKRLPVIDLVSSSDSESDSVTEGEKRRRRGSAVDDTGAAAPVFGAVGAPRSPEEQFIGYAASGDVAGMEAMITAPDDTGFYDWNCIVDNTTPLMAAAANGRLDTVSFIVGLGVNQNMQNAEGKTALMLAIERHHARVVRMLLNRKTNKELKDTALRSIKDYAEASGNADIIGAVTAHCDGVGALPAASAADREAASLAFFNATTRSAVDRGDVTEMERLYTTGHIPDLNWPSPAFNNYTALMRAASTGNVRLVEWLVDKGANTGMRHPDDGMTALMMAAKHGHKDTVIYLMRTSNTAIKDNEGKTAEDHAPAGSETKRVLVEYRENAPAAFFEAVARGRANIIMNLIDVVGVGINCVDPTTGKTALMLAIEKGYCEIAMLLIGLGANKNMQCALGNTALHYAVSAGQLALVKALLRPFDGLAEGVDVSITNAAGETAMDLATCLGNAAITQAVRDVVERLKECCICMETIRATDVDILSCRKGTVDCAVAGWLQAAMADGAEHLFHKGCLMGWTSISHHNTCPNGREPLSAACLTACRGVAAPAGIALAVPVAGVLMERVAGPHGGPYGGPWWGDLRAGATTPLIRAVAGNNLVMVQNLIAGGANVNQVDAQGQTALSVFLSNLHHGNSFSGGIHSGILIALLDASADVISPVPALVHYYNPAITNMSPYAWVNAINYHTQLARHLIDVRYARQVVGLPGWRN